jgi:hypothetical protein
MPGPRCAGCTALFFSDKASDQAQAKEMCSKCPLVVRCLVKALRRKEPAGVWGGHTTEERQDILTAVRRRAAL